MRKYLLIPALTVLISACGTNSHKGNDPGVQLDEGDKGDGGSDCDIDCDQFKQDATGLRYCECLASDNCTDVVITQSKPAGSNILGQGTIFVTITATDAKGNASTCEVPVTTFDDTAPVITQSLLSRLRSRDDRSFSDRLLAAMRNQFGGHAVKDAK